MDWLNHIFVFDDYGDLLVLFKDSIIVGAILGLLGGLVGTFVVMRDLAFAVHGISEISFAGAALFLLIGADVVTGSLVGSVVTALVLAFLGVRARGRNSIIGVLMPFGLGLGILFISLYQGRSSNKFGLLTGQIVSVDSQQLTVLSIVAAVVIVALVIMWRPLTFASADPEIAVARGVPVRGLTIAFMLVLGVSVALSIQVVGTLLVLALLITPAAAATLVTSSPRMVVLLSVIFAIGSTVGGILLALGGGIPISPYVTTISFTIWLVCKIIASVRSRRGSYGRVIAPSHASKQASF